jgi:hypothetical protein
MEHEGSFPCSQWPTVGPCPEPDKFNPHPKSYVSKLHFYFVPTPLSRSPFNIHVNDIMYWNHTHSNRIEMCDDSN